MTIPEILAGDDPVELKALFSFSSTDSDEAVLLKFNLWGRKLFPKYFSSHDTAFHKEINLYNLCVYRGRPLPKRTVRLEQFVDIAFRGAAKTVKTKLLFAFCIANDTDHFRRYIKVFAEDLVNSVQIVTDIYNIMVQPHMVRIYPEIFEKTDAKRSERMNVFDTSTGVKVFADSVGDGGRGALAEDARPDVLWFEDFENRKTLRSAVKTIAIWANMEEARTGLALGGGSIYTCNYISEQGNVHKLVTEKLGDFKKILILPIHDGKQVQLVTLPNPMATQAWIGNIAWSRYTAADIAQMMVVDDDFEGERMCKPSASRDVIFDRDVLDKMPVLAPYRTIAELNLYKKFDASHRYGSGHDVAAGVGLDSSTTVIIDFDTIPAQVVATYQCNTIKEDTFAHAIQQHTDHFGGCICGIEKNNYGSGTIAIGKTLDLNMFWTPPKDTKAAPEGYVSATGNSEISKEYGWHTNANTKPKMIFAFMKAVHDGHLQLNSQALINECKAYTRNDLLTEVKDPRLTTRHFDLLIAACIAWQMNGFSELKEEEDDTEFEEDAPLYPDIG